MAAFPNATRRHRFKRTPLQGRVSLSTTALRLLQAIAAYDLLTGPMAARAAGIAIKTARPHLRMLFDAGVIDVLAVSRAALSDPMAVGDPSLALGTAPNLVRPTRAGLKLLVKLGLLDTIPPASTRAAPSDRFLAHCLLVKDVRLYLECAARGTNGCALMDWREGQAAVIDLKRLEPPRYLRPDAWFTLRLARAGGAAVLVGLVEADRGTERLTVQGGRWVQKLQAYAALFDSGLLKATTGYVNARILVVVPDAPRRDRLAQFIAAQAAPSLSARFWLAERSVLEQPDLTRPVWQRPGQAALCALLPREAG